MVNRTSVSDGQDGRICPQTYPNWNDEQEEFTNAYLSNPNNISAFQEVPAPGVATKPSGQQDGRATEDCLFLDVLVPEAIYDNKAVNGTGGVPVLVYTFGGGYYEGYKQMQGSPAEILARSTSNLRTSPGVIWVQMNYRIGALGWLAGPSFQASGGVANAGLYDQLLALEWVQKYIHLFGGDPHKVTLQGESAGAAMTIYQITAFGGTRGDAPFQQAFINSPAATPATSSYLMETFYTQFLQYANATSLADLRNLSSAQIIEANELLLFNSPYGIGNVGPAVDGIIIPQLVSRTYWICRLINFLLADIVQTSQLLAQGRRAKNVRRVMASHTSNEGFIFVNPAVQNNSAFDDWLSSTLIPDASPAVRDYVSSELYPPIFNESTTLGYNDTITRAAAAFADRTIACNVGALFESIGSEISHGYLFAEGAGFHSEDVSYNFWNGPSEDKFGLGLVNATVAEAIQEWMIGFGVTGTPTGRGSIDSMPVYGKNRMLALLTNNGFDVNVTDPAQKKRCDFWQKGLYF